jgi:hypothetical protein
MGPKTTDQRQATADHSMRRVPNARRVTEHEFLLSAASERENSRRQQPFSRKGLWYNRRVDFPAFRRILSQVLSHTISQFSSEKLPDAAAVPGWGE